MEDITNADNLRKLTTDVNQLRAAPERGHSENLTALAEDPWSIARRVAPAPLPFIFSPPAPPDIDGEYDDDNHRDEKDRSVHGDLRLTTASDTSDNPRSIDRDAVGRK